MQLHLRINPQYLVVRCVLPLALLGFSVALVLLLNGVFNSNDARSEQGVLDLRHWDSKNSDILIAGEWAFYWNEYLMPEDLEEDNFYNAPSFLQLPGVWSDTHHNGQPLPILGHASLALHMLLPLNKQYLLKIPTLTNRYRLWVNGVLRVNDPLEKALASHHQDAGVRFLTLEPIDGVVTLLFHIQNDRHRAGGIWEHLRLTELGQRDRVDFWPKIIDASLAFLLSCVAVILVVLALVWQRSSYIFLASFAAVMSVRAGTVNERLLFELMGIQRWETQQAIEHAALFATLPFFALYLGKRFPSYFPSILHWVTTVISGVLLALVAITPASVYSHTIPIFQVTALSYALLWMGATLEHVRQKERAAILLLLGGMMFIVAGVNDILYSLNWIDSTNLTHAGALGFMVVAFFYRGEMIKRGVILESYGIGNMEGDATISNIIEETHFLSPYFQAYREEPNDSTRKQLTAESLRYTLGLWEKVMNKNKISLAENSGLWRVTNDGGTLKTRTLDKYLKVDTLPKNPRYKLVSKTLRYVVQQDGIDEKDKKWILRVSEVYDE